MNRDIEIAAAGAVSAKVVIERTYRARPQELWDLWTTKKGFESWWGPQGFRVDVHVIDARLGGLLHYDMIADAPAQIAAMKKMGQPLSHETRGTYSEMRPLERLALTHVIDFLPGLKPFDSTMAVDFFPVGDAVRMVVTLDPMPTPELTRMTTEGFTSQIGKLDERFAELRAPRRPGGG